MGKKLKKKAPKKKKTYQKNYDSGSIDWGICERSTSDSEPLHDEDEQANDLSSMNLLSSGDTSIYPFGKYGSDRETTKFSLMGEEERYQIEAKFKRLIDKIRDQQDLLNKRECAFKEEATKLKAPLEEGNKVRKLFKDKYQEMQDEVTSLRDEVSEKSTTIKKLRDRSSYYESLEATILLLKEDLEESQKKNRKLLQAHEKQENEVLDIRHQLEEDRKAEENMKKRYLEKEEQHQVEVNMLKDKLEEKDKLV